MSSKNHIHMHKQQLNDKKPKVNLFKSLPRLPARVIILELAFISKTFDKQNITKVLNECLISDEEFKLGDSEWKKMFVDPFTVLEDHPMKLNFKAKDGDWKDLDEKEIDEGVFFS